jgi:hypothetical protein
MFKNYFDQKVDFWWFLSILCGLKLYDFLSWDTLIEMAEDVFDYGTNDHYYRKTIVKVKTIVNSYYNRKKPATLLS